jgi:threonine synthase
MQLYSTQNKNHLVNLEKAVMESLAPNGGLYMPRNIQPFEEGGFLDMLEGFTFQDIAYNVTHQLVGDYLGTDVINDIVDTAINFSAPVVKLDDRRFSLELWHGPSLAFKDFGARYMAALMSHFLKGSDRKTTILVATSGDTGGAVAAGFLGVENVEVIILYPSGKVSDLQEKQLTTLGNNIHAVEVNGTFDDCQSLVKQAFLDPAINTHYSLSSANSINIARLIPQSFYYFESYKQVIGLEKKVVYSVPSGNFGNLTAGLIAKRLGLPISRFIAATNINKIVPDYLSTGTYQPLASKQTISNAMDVGNPSNWVRIMEMYNHDHDSLLEDVQGFWLNDQETREAMVECYQNHQYITDPHGAIAYRGLDLLEDDEIGIFLETAHPAKFLDVVNPTLGFEIPVPDALAHLQSKIKTAAYIDEPTYPRFFEYLMDRK